MKRFILFFVLIYLFLLPFNMEAAVKINGIEVEWEEYVWDPVKSEWKKLDGTPCTWDDVTKVEVNSYDLPGLSIESGYKRHYPYEGILAHSVGYIAPPAENEIEKGETLLFMHPNFMIGKSGAEKAYEKTLRGEAGLKYTEVNAFGIPVKTLSTKNDKKMTLI